MPAPAVDLVLSLASLPAALAAAYLGLLALLARRPGASPPATRPARFVVVVPAHDEEAGIGETVGSLLSVSYPREAFRVLVVADNCTDHTADRAAAAGADVLVRADPDRRGKGYALRLAFDRILAAGEADAIAVVDADTVVSPNLLEAFSSRLARGAGALQAHYGVRNATDSWRTRLLTIAFACMHGVRSLARERLSLSCGLRGNGMAFSRQVLQETPHEAWSVVEDLEYGIQLGYAGHRVHYVHEAEVLGHMASSEGASRSQRRRWEGGRRAIARAHVGPLFRRALRERDPVLADLAIDVLVPPLATIASWCAVGIVACLAARALGFPVVAAPLLLGASVLALLVHVLRGWSLSGTGPRGLLDLLLAPVYVAWKIALRLMPSRHGAGEWVRTKRPGED